MFYDLPNDLQAIVLNFLSMSEIAKLAFVSKDAKKFSENSQFWKYKIKTDLNVSASDNINSYKLEYKKQRDEKLKELILKINSESLFDILKENEIISEEIIENYLETNFSDDFLIIVANFNFRESYSYHATIKAMIEKVAQNEKLLKLFNPHQLYSLIINLHGRNLTAVAEHLLDLILNNTTLLATFISDGNLEKIINFLDKLGDEFAIEKLTLILDAMIADDELFKNSINSLEMLDRICEALPKELTSYVDILRKVADRLDLPNNVIDGFDLAFLDDEGEDEKPLRELLFT